MKNTSSLALTCITALEPAPFSPGKVERRLVASCHLPLLVFGPKHNKNNLGRGHSAICSKKYKWEVFSLEGIGGL